MAPGTGAVRLRQLQATGIALDKQCYIMLLCIVYLDLQIFEHLAARNKAAAKAKLSQDPYYYIVRPDHSCRITS